MMDDKSLSQTVDWNSRSVHGVPVDVVALRHIVSSVPNISFHADLLRRFKDRMCSPHSDY